MRGRWRFDGEYRTSKRLTRILGVPRPLQQSGQVSPGWFTALSFRISQRLEIGAYRSQFQYSPLFNPPLVLTGAGANHIDDTTVTVRIDPAPHWNIKIEGH